MLDINPPTPPAIKSYFVLLTTVTSLEVKALSEADAMVIAVKSAPALMDPQELKWVVHHVSDKPFDIVDEDPEAAKE